MNQRAKSHKPKVSRSLKNQHPKIAIASAAKFQRLAQAIAAVSIDHKHSKITHEECQELLAFYVESEKRGENAPKLYPGIFEHLNACVLCQLSYESLTEAIPRKSDREFTLPPETKIELPFLVRSNPRAAWGKQVLSSIGGAPLGFRFIINPSHLARVIAPPPQFAVRGEIARTRSLLLSDSIALGKRNVAVELWMHPLDKSDHFRLEISVVPSSPLPEPLRVKLHWNNHQFSARIQQGAGWIDQIPVRSFENASVSVEFEAGPNSISAEDEHGDGQ